MASAETETQVHVPLHSRLLARPANALLHRGASAHAPHVEGLHTVLGPGVLQWRKRYSNRPEGPNLEGTAVRPISAQAIS
jgi:hypothetical protein